MGANQTILVAGGGIGGLATALALGRRGRKVCVIEEAAEFGAAVGYGIQLGPNVIPMLERLGIADEVLAHSIKPRGVVMLDALRGDEIVRIPTGSSFQQRFGYPYIVIHRVDLHQVMVDACRKVPAIELIASAQLRSFDERPEAVRVTSSDGRVFEGAALVGADGLRSQIRCQMFGESEPRMSGYVAHRTIIPTADIPDGVLRDDVVLWSGPGFHIVHYPLRDGTEFNIVAVFRTSTFAERGDPDFHRREVERVYRIAHPPMRALLQKMNLDRRWAISDRDPIRHWSAGKVALLGDAAHATLQSLAQGAGMAIEDGVTLAAATEKNPDDLAKAFEHYEKARYVRTARVQLESRYLWEIYHAEDIARDVMRQSFIGRSEREMFDCLSWLYDSKMAVAQGAVL